jgi:NADPH:quinone reductase-like Zn-dependent oxidoreductase
MRAIQIDRHGGPDVLELREVPDSVLRPGGVLIRTIASSINPVDWKTREWDRGPAFPMTLGWDLAGVVIDSDDPEFRAGDRVVAMSGQLGTGVGVWSDLVCLPGTLIAPAPSRRPLVDSAALPLAGMTAALAMERLNLAPGDRILVIGAVGGTGSLVVQLARHRGAIVDALVSRPAHIAGARDLGAARAFTPTEKLDRGAYDAVFDTASVDPGPALRPGGKYVSITDDPLPPIPNAEKPQVAEDSQVLRRLVRLVDDGTILLRIGAYYSITDIRQAHRRFEAGGLGGKLILLF